MKRSFYGSGMMLFFLLQAGITARCQKIDTAMAAALVPKDLKTDNKILLVKIDETERKKIAEYKKLFSKNYIGLFQIVPFYVSIDESYPDVQLYKYVLVINSSLSKDDFTDKSNKALFFGLRDSSFTKRGGALFIFDRSSDHDLYESGIGNMKKVYRSGSEYAMSGKFSNYANAGPGNFSSYSYEEKTNFRRLKALIELLNDY